MGSIDLPRWLVVTLAACTAILVITVLVGVGIYIGEWGEYDKGRQDEQSDQEWADNHLVVPRHEDGGFHVPNGDQVVIVGKTKVLPAEILVNRKALEDELVPDTRYQQSTNPNTDSESEWGRTHTFRFSPRR